jgi:hypothetical protein
MNKKEKASIRKMLKRYPFLKQEIKRHKDTLKETMELLNLGGYERTQAKLKDIYTAPTNQTSNPTEEVILKYLEKITEIQEEVLKLINLKYNIENFLNEYLTPEEKLVCNFKYLNLQQGESGYNKEVAKKMKTDTHRVFLIDQKILEKYKDVIIIK